MIKQREPIVPLTYENNKKTIQKMLVIFVIAVILLSVIWYFLPPLDVEESTKDRIRNYLGDKPLVIEVAYMNSTSPSLSALALLEERIRQYSTDSDKEISFTLSQVPQANTVYTPSLIRSLEQEHRLTYTTGDVSSLFIVYLNGQFQTINVVGYAYSNSSFAIFQETMASYVNSTVLPFNLDDYEKSIVIHEWGHILGLVNIGYTSNIPNREDANHPYHSRNIKSVMHYAVEFIGITATPPTDFDITDQRDITDLKQSSGLSTGFDILIYRLNKFRLSYAIPIILAILITAWICMARLCPQVCSDQKNSGSKVCKAKKEKMKR